MQTSVLVRTSPQPECSPTEELARKWAVTFAELFCVSLKERGPRFVALWVSALSDMKPDALDAACRRGMQTCKFFPTPAEIRAQIEHANTRGLDLEGSEAWERWFKHVKRFFHADLGWDRRTPPLDAITEHAGRAAGGARWVEGCPESELQWARKRFIDAYKLAHETGQVRNLLTRDEAKQILKTLTAEASPKELE